jgi:hypothetical protein
VKRRRRVDEDRPKRKVYKGRDHILIVGDYTAIEQGVLDMLVAGGVPAGLPEERAPDTGWRGAGIHTGRIHPARCREAGRCYETDERVPRVLPLVVHDDMGLFESAVRILLGLQTDHGAELLEMSDAGDRAKVRMVGWEGWVETRAILNMELRTKEGL